MKSTTRGRERKGLNFTNSSLDMKLLLRDESISNNRIMCHDNRMMCRKRRKWSQNAQRRWCNGVFHRFIDQERSFLSMGIFWDFVADVESVSSSVNVWDLLVPQSQYWRSSCRDEVSISLNEARLTGRPLVPCLHSLVCRHWGFPSNQKPSVVLVLCPLRWSWSYLWVNYLERDVGEISSG